MSNNEKRNLDTAANLCKAWNDHDPDGFARHFAEDGIWLLARGNPPDGFTVKGKPQSVICITIFAQRFRIYIAKYVATGPMATIEPAPSGTLQGLGPMVRNSIG